jgi:hypothetical protein
MRKTLALAALAAAAVSIVPMTSASAQCYTIEGIPGCHNPCTIVARATGLPLICTQ